jgi:hypothetical protein
MVEIYFNAQSDNGTLTSSEWPSGCCCALIIADVTARPCSSGVVAELYAKHTTGKGPQSAVEASKLDDASGICRGRVPIVDFTPERMVDRCGVQTQSG